MSVNRSFSLFVSFSVMSGVMVRPRTSGKARSFGRPHVCQPVNSKSCNGCLWECRAHGTPTACLGLAPTFVEKKRLSFPRRALTFLVFSFVFLVFVCWVGWLLLFFLLLFFSSSFFFFSSSFLLLFIIIIFFSSFFSFFLFSGSCCTCGSRIWETGR